jgi:hypothetical protein
MSDPSAANTRNAPPRCLECDYNLTGIDSERCPECGQLVDWAQVRRFAAGLALLVPPSGARNGYRVWRGVMHYTGGWMVLTALAGAIAVAATALRGLSEGIGLLVGIAALILVEVSFFWWWSALADCIEARRRSSSSPVQAAVIVVPLFALTATGLVAAAAAVLYRALF